MLLNIKDAEGKGLAFPVVKGKDGKSAYEYAKASGYMGTEAQFAQRLATPIPVTKPYILYAENSEQYETDDSALTEGDYVLQAILAGRQILVCVPNADGGNHTKIFSPVYMYQLPNYQNNYLYLFYLRDEKQTLDLSALGMGTIQLPVYGELKMKLSETYNESPL